MRSFHIGLITDDNEAITDSLKRGLELSREYLVDTYNNPEKALVKLKPGAHDIVILDIRMPRMNGFEVYHALRNIDGAARLCFLTGFEIFESEFGKMFQVCFQGANLTLRINEHLK